MRVLLAIDHNEPAQVARFNACWQMSDAERAVYAARAAASRRFAADVRSMGKLAAVSAQVQRTMTGASA